MTLWIVVAAMTALALALLLAPLLRRAEGAAPRAAYDMEIYRDQLAEIDRELERGMLDTAEAEAARAEIGRRALAAEAAATAADTRQTPAPAPRWRIVALGAGVPIAAVLLYLGVGKPELGDREQAVDDQHAAAPQLKV